jgi:hypothetical protein
VRADPEKIKAILEWAAPTLVKGVRGFLGFANFYQRFIRDFTTIAASLTNLTRKDTSFRWTDIENTAFERLKYMFVFTPILKQFNPDHKTLIECDSSGYAIGDALMQYDEEGILRPAAFFSQKNSPAEYNYEIHDKELLAIVKCLRE